MFDFFKGWRRKAGCVTLVMACVFTVGWMRSMLTDDYISIFDHAFYSSKGEFALDQRSSLDMRSSAWDSKSGLFPPEMGFSGTAYSTVAITLMVASAVLLLWPPRRAKPKAQPDA